MSLLERSWVGRSVPVPVVPINFLSVPFYLLIYITIYILSSYRVSIKGCCPMKTYLEQLEQLEQLERLPKIISVLILLPASPKSPFSLESLDSVLSVFTPAAEWFPIFAAYLINNLFLCLCRVPGKHGPTFYAAKLRLLFGIRKVFGAFSWWFIKKWVVLCLKICSFFDGIIREREIGVNGKLKS